MSASAFERALLAAALAPALRKAAVAFADGIPPDSPLRSAAAEKAFPAFKEMVRTKLKSDPSTELWAGPVVTFLNILYATLYSESRSSTNP